MMSFVSLPCMETPLYPKQACIPALASSKTGSIHPSIYGCPNVGGTTGNTFTGPLPYIECLSMFVLALEPSQMRSIGYPESFWANLSVFVPFPAVAGDELTPCSSNCWIWVNLGSSNCWLKLTQFPAIAGDFLNSVCSHCWNWVN